MKISKIVESYDFAKVVQNKHEDIKFMLFLQIQTHEIWGKIFQHNEHFLKTTNITICLNFLKVSSDKKYLRVVIFL